MLRMKGCPVSDSRAKLAASGVVVCTVIVGGQETGDSVRSTRVDVEMENIIHEE
jgi:hypothetical protein